MTRRATAPQALGTATVPTSRGHQRELCAVPHCGGTLEYDVDALGRIASMIRAFKLDAEMQLHLARLLGRSAARCPRCIRRARLEHEGRLRPASTDREPDPSVGTCQICGDVLTPPYQTKCCAKVTCRRAWKAQYQRRHFGRSAPASNANDPSLFPLDDDSDTD